MKERIWYQGETVTYTKTPEGMVCQKCGETVAGDKLSEHTRSHQPCKS